MALFSLITRIYARHPPAIAVTLGGLGLLFNMPHAGVIFVAGVVMQLFWVYITGI